jgi:hypothetical protein
MITADSPICPICHGTGASPRQTGPKRLPDDPTRPGERNFDLGADKCPECGGAGRVARRP